MLLQSPYLVVYYAAQAWIGYGLGNDKMHDRTTLMPRCCDSAPIPLACRSTANLSAPPCDHPLQIYAAALIAFLGSFALHKTQGGLLRLSFQMGPHRCTPSVLAAYELLGCGHVQTRESPDGLVATFHVDSHADVAGKLLPWLRYHEHLLPGFGATLLPATVALQTSQGRLKVSAHVVRWLKLGIRGA